MFHIKQNTPINVAYYSDSAEEVEFDYDNITHLCIHKQIDQETFDLTMFKNLQEVGFYDNECTTKLVFDGELCLRNYKSWNGNNDYRLIPMALPKFYKPSILVAWTYHRTVNPILLEFRPSTKTKSARKI